MWVEEYELLGETKTRVSAMREGFDPPTVEWPKGTTVVEQPNSLFDRPDWEASTVAARFSRFHLVTLPSGGQIITLTSLGRLGGPDDHDKPWFDAKAPHVVWSVLTEVETGLVVMRPRVCNMSARRRSSDFQSSYNWINPELGLEDVKVGRVDRLHEINKTETVFVGWSE